MQLLHQVLHAVDGRRTVAEVAAVVGQATGRLVRPDDVRHLVDTSLRPLGLLQRADGSEPELKRSDPLLALRFRRVVSDPTATRRVTAPFAVFFTPLLVIPVVLGFGAVAGWVLFSGGLAAATAQAFRNPALFLTVVLVTVLSAGFHEFGHALHGLLSDVTYPLLSGTAVARDFVELPSQLYEHWLEQPEVLRRHARHHRTGEPMPEDLLRRLLAERGGLREGRGSVFIAVETVYSMDGTIAPLREIVALAEELLPRGNAHVVVDEAHATGIYGPQGRGVVAMLGLEDKVLARLHTFGKALAASGGARLMRLTREA